MAWAEGHLDAVEEGGRSYQRIVTDGKEHPSLAFTATPPARPIDARHRFLEVLLRVHGLDRLAHIEVRLGSDSMKTSWYAFPVPLFADLDFNYLQDGEWMPVTLSFGEAQPEGKPDRAAIDSIGIMVRDQGKGPVEVDFGGWALVDDPPEGILSFTFDDGWKDDVKAARMMAKHGMRGTAYIIPHTVGTPGYMTIDDVATLAKMGWEIASHHETPITDFPPGDLERELRAIQTYLVKAGYAQGALHFAYPNGRQEPRRVRPTVRRLFETARLAGGGPETIPPGDPRLLRALNVTNETTPEQVGAWARRAREQHEWAILMFHLVPEHATQATAYSEADFAKLLDAVAASGVHVEPVIEVWRGCCAPPALVAVEGGAGAQPPAAPGR
jgi:peptidoglycan/xylan/chitin deacetylase (PgdA/CDA1 family)